MDAIEQARQLIEAQLKQLDAEREQLLGALGALPSADGGSPSRSRAARARRKRARRGQREAQFVADLTDHPDATVAEIAGRLGVAPQGLYPIARRLVANGSIAKRGHLYSVVALPAPANGTAHASV